MRHFQKIASGIDVVPLLMQLNRNPDLWDANPERRMWPGSAHTAMRDIWVRLRAREELVNPSDYNTPHHTVWYPAFHKLPALRPILVGPTSIQARCESVHLGTVLITRVPPGCQIDPHNDKGAWVSEYHNCKVYIPLQANSRCTNTSADETVVMGTGEAWIFDNLVDHSVVNAGDEDRITLIIAMRVE